MVNDYTTYKEYEEILSDLELVNKGEMLVSEYITKYKSESERRI